MVNNLSFEANELLSRLFCEEGDCRDTMIGRDEIMVEYEDETVVESYRYIMENQSSLKIFHHHTFQSLTITNTDEIQRIAELIKTYYEVE